MSVFAHEYGYDLGLPDLYDTQRSGGAARRPGRRCLGNQRLIAHVPPSTLPPKAPRGPSDQIKPLTVRGTIEAGRQPACCEFVTATSRFVLSGDLGRKCGLVMMSMK